MGSLAHGDLGHSWSENAPVSSLILQYLPWTLGLLLVATIIAFVGGTAIGILIAWRRGSWLDWLLPGATVFEAVPFFFLALVLLLVFGPTGTMLKAFPSLFSFAFYHLTRWPTLPSIDIIPT